MLTNNPKISSLAYNDAVSRLMEGNSIAVEDARSAIASMSFKDYHRLIEATADIVPPSGKVISPQQQAASNQPAPQAGQAPAVPGQPFQPIQPGTQPAPQAGQAPGQPPVAGQAIQQQAQQLVPPGSKVPVIPGKPGQPVQPGQVQTEEGAMLQRLRELAGIKEDASCGATGAGAIAMAPSAMGKVKRRGVEEAPKKEYTRTAPPKTIVGDTKPFQASGELSATNAARGIPTASRKRNGLKK
jgi:hypothetical protein